jgi:hypothetical protein
MNWTVDLAHGLAAHFAAADIATYRPGCTQTTKPALSSVSCPPRRPA